ncbi:site-specific integrase [Rhodococcus sp. USK10]|uniref:tyrosine-type recombinase/integrase n=1 Tax=Rhodococcus sp. USK10 TaxID=2789739 RepID=UPI001C5EB091|nr:site-specific integrase [Rhodococcus sp. USK10]QYB05417.1 site-specific integrase [Rhodococcus sp. USK10]
MGSIQKRTYTEGKAPRYVARVRVGGREVSKSFAKQGDARDWIREREGLNPTGKRVDNRMLSAVLKEAIPHAATESTRAGRAHLAANLGDLAYMKLGDVTAGDIRDWKHTLEDGRPWAGGKPLANSSIKTLFGILSALFNDAVAQGQIPRNPVTSVRRGGETNQAVEPHQILKLEQLRALIDAASEPFATMIEFGATTGLRAGEMGGLRVYSVDATRKVVDVIEQADGHHTAFGWRELKSRKSRRTIPLPDSTLRAVEAHLEAHPDYEPHSPLFRAAQGGQWSSAHIAKMWRATAEDAGVEGHSWHSLRHFYASALIASGASVTTVQNRLGHASPMVTLQVYSHLWPGEDDKTRAVFDGLL